MFKIVIFLKSDKKEEFKFSFFSFICPSFIKNPAYSKALNYLNQYTSLENIIKLLQDVEKLKLVLFDEKQRRVFEMLPKPGIGNEKLKKDYLTIESLVDGKKAKRTRESNFKLMNVLNNDPLTQRMIKLLEPDMKSSIRSIECIFKRLKIFHIMIDASPPLFESQKKEAIPSIMINYHIFKYFIRRTNYM